MTVKKSRRITRLLRRVENRLFDTPIDCRERFKDKEAVAVGKLGTVGGG